MSTRLALLTLVLWSSACHPTTEIVVVVQSDLATPLYAQLTVKTPSGATAYRSDCLCVGEAAGCSLLPLVLGLVPDGAGDGPIDVQASAFADASCATELVTQQGSARFVAGRRLTLELELLQICGGVGCNPGETCVHGGCVSSFHPVLPDFDVPKPADFAIAAADDAGASDLSVGPDDLAIPVDLSGPLDFSGGSWKAGPPLAIPRFSAAAVLGPDNRVYVIGGDDSGGLSTAVEAYDQTTHTWLARAALPTARSGLGAAVGPDGRIYAIGGHTQAGAVSTVEAYTPSTDTWDTTIAPAYVAEDLAAVSLPGTHQIVLTGGFDGMNQLGTTMISSTTLPLSWTAATSMSTPRSKHAAVVLAGEVYVSGGADSTGFATDSVERYSRTTGMWGAGPPLAKLSRHGAAIAADGLHYVVGGLDYSFGPLDTVSRSNGTSAWVTAPHLTLARGYLSVVADSNGSIWAIGGIGTAPGVPLDTVEIFSF